MVRQLCRVAMLLVAAVTASCATGGAVPQPFPRAQPSPHVTEPPAVSDTAESPARTNVLTTALALQGAPYLDGGSDPSGFDCSGFVQYVFARAGIVLPRAVRDQFNRGAPVERDNLRAGDLVFFETVSRGASHVGLLIDADEFIHAPSSNGVVRLERLSSRYWATRYVGGRRVAAPISTTD